MKTIPHLFLERVTTSAAQTAIFSPRDRLDDSPLETVPAIEGFVERTWSQVASDVANRARFLTASGIGKNDRVVHLAGNSYDWVVTDLAIQFAGAIHVPLHALSTAYQVAQLVSHCQPRAIIVSDQEQAKKLSTADPDLPDKFEAFSYHSLKTREFEIRNGSTVGQSLVVLQNMLDASAIDGQHLISILYTSGTTGEPKGVMLSQFNVVANVNSKLAVLPLDENDIRLCFLPMTHIFARVCDIYTWIASGSRLAISRGQQYLFDELKTVRPTYINAVPYFYDKCWRTLRDTGRLDCETALAEMLGGRVRLCNCGGAAIADHVFDYFWKRNINLITGYGLTETSPVVTSSTPQKIRRRAVGRAIPSVEIKLQDDGEICVRGDNVMQGYFRDESATATVLRDGWFLSGDIGEIDEDGFLFIVGRKKELIVTSGGKNISPVYLESLLNEDPLIHQSVVIGNDRDYLVALIVPYPERPDPFPEPAKWEAMIRERIDRRLSIVSQHEQIGRFFLLDEPFSLENQMLTAKSSLRREEVGRRYQDVIEELYQRDEPQIFSQQKI